MPGQKNKGNRGSQTETPTTKKNNSFFDAYMSDIRKEGKVEDIYVARVIRNVGNGRVDVFYVGPRGARTEKAYIRGLFRGKGKHSVDIGVNSIVLVADTGISGSAQFEIMCLLSPDHIRELRKAVDLDSRILNFEATDGEELMKNEKVDLGGFDFIGGDDDTKFTDDEDDEIDVDAI